MHIYLSVGRYNEETGTYEDPAGNPNVLVNYRGETHSTNEEIQSFIVKMEKQGHAVFALSSPVKPGTRLTDDDDFHFIANYNKAFKGFAQTLNGGQS